MRKNIVVDEYNKLLRIQQANKDRMSNLQREKDYKVQKIEKKYESEIEDCIRDEKSIGLQLDIVKKYISEGMKKESK